MIRELFKKLFTNLSITIKHENGKRLFHLINPQTGKPVINHIFILGDGYHELVSYGHTNIIVYYKKREIHINKKQFDKSKTNTKYQKIFAETKGLDYQMMLDGKYGKVFYY